MSSRVETQKPGEVVPAVPVLKRSQPQQLRLTKKRRAKITSFTQEYMTNVNSSIYGVPGSRRMMKALVKYINEDIPDDDTEIISSIRERSKRSRNNAKITQEHVERWLINSKDLRNPFLRSIPLGKQGQGVFKNDTGKDTPSMRSKRIFLGKSSSNNSRPCARVLRSQSRRNNTASFAKAWKELFPDQSIEIKIKKEEPKFEPEEWEESDESDFVPDLENYSNVPIVVPQNKPNPKLSLHSQESGGHSDNDEIQELENIVVKVEPVVNFEFEDEVGGMDQVGKRGRKRKRSKAKARKVSKKSTGSSNIERAMVVATVDPDPWGTDVDPLTTTNQCTEAKIQHVRNMVTEVRLFCVKNEEFHCMLPMLDCVYLLIPSLVSYRPDIQPDFEI